MKKRLPKNFNIFEFFIIILLVMISLFYLNGCTITPKALGLAKEKAAPQYEYWNIKRLVSAVKQENGDVSLCVELNNTAEIEEPQLSTLTIPLAILNGEADQHKKYGFYPGECPLPCYWYPIEKIDKGCDKTPPENGSTKSILAIEKTTISSQEQLYDLLNSYNENQKIPDAIFEISDVSGNISSIYWFVRIDQQRTSANSIAGIYEDKSTHLYYLTVPAAVIGDVIIDTVAVAVAITGIALGAYLRLQ